ncbi:hypothetical protein AVEN_231909-1 [Araneus ventricosus]|uniref:Uncharacterized protein n=1 Tax=Araneus ventricosus TaxID=182803 RepID=A0A4Y2S8D0_ARAVE|nr:hypothetical protein AVEN_231909-1 [Araneus ventricosus]
MQVHDTLSISQPGYHETVRNYPPLRSAHIMRAVSKEFITEKPAEDESDAPDLDGELTQYSYYETDSEICGGQSSSRRRQHLRFRHKCVYHLSIQPLILYHNK